jgi:hypothetical protein
LPITMSMAFVCRLVAQEVVGQPLAGFYGGITERHNANIAACSQAEVERHAGRI